MTEQQQILSILGRLRSRIRTYVLLEGVTAVVAVLCLLFWITFGLDLVHFGIRKLELPGWFRTLCLLGMAGVTIASLVSWVGLRFFRGFRSRALALVLERRFPELDDRFITAVELMERQSEQTPLQAAMSQRTIRQASDLAAKLELGEVFNFGPLRRNLIAAAVLVTSVLIFGITNADAMGRWLNAFVLGRADYWEPFRQSEMSVHALTQPGDRRREFADDGTLKHPRGSDLTLVAVSGEGKLPPEKVTLQFVSFGGSGTQRGRVTMNSSGSSEFRHTLSRVIDDHHLWVTGGDFVNRTPYRILIVDPPRVDQIQLRCDYPTYTGKDSLEDKLVDVVGTQVSLPVGTQFDMLATVNKPLAEFHVRSARFELSYRSGESTAQLVLIDPETEAKRVVTVTAAGDLVTSEGTQFQLPFRLAPNGDAELDSIGDETTFPLPLPPDTGLQLTLRDTDDIDSPDPAILLVNGIVDLEPVVDSRLKGVTAVITRGASIPVEGKILDDYGVNRAWFGYRIDQGAEERVRELSQQPSGQREFPLQISTDEPVERFAVLPLELKEGQVLTLGVFAEDGDTLTGPHVGHGEMFTFTIVSKDELLARLYDREVNLRLRFEQIREEVGDLRTSLDSHIEMSQERTQLRGDAQNREKTDQLNVAIAAFAERALHQLRKNHTESRAIEIGFRELREEIVNNRVDTKEILDRIDGGVLAPMSILNEEEFGTADEGFGNFRLVNERQGETTPAMQTAGVALDAMLARMDRILAEMKDRGTFNELMQQLQLLIENEQKLIEETEKKRNESFFNNLGN
ncbi:MAG: hypothetical protein KDA58_04665 [Planctomycetaceae bacterium]|nr:hypothetical protein [Planctomycetaceae bacterium]